MAKRAGTPSERARASQRQPLAPRIPSAQTPRPTHWQRPGRTRSSHFRRNRGTGIDDTKLAVFIKSRYTPGNFSHLHYFSIWGGIVTRSRELDIQSTGSLRKSVTEHIHARGQHGSGVGARRLVTHVATHQCFSECCPRARPVDALTLRPCLVLQAGMTTHLPNSVPADNRYARPRTLTCSARFLGPSYPAGLALRGDAHSRWWPPARAGAATLRPRARVFRRRWAWQQYNTATTGRRTTF